MRIAVLGCTFHLGPVFAACLAELGHDVVGHDESGGLTNRAFAMSTGRMPVSEPGLSELVVAMVSSGRLRFTDSLTDAVPEADVVIIAWDTPVDDLDRADPEFVIRNTAEAFPFINPNTLVVVSSQLPVGSVARLEQMWRMFGGKPEGGAGVTFACVPENLQLGCALESFRKERVRVFGVRSNDDHMKLRNVFCVDKSQSHGMLVESAEILKSARNAHIAAQITLTNEIASLCEKTGASAREVERGLRADKRMGACLRPGEAIAGGTLLRDIGYLNELSAIHDTAAYLASAIKKANDHHLAWTRRVLLQAIAPLSGKTVAVWGLAYKACTSTLRRSSSRELCDWLLSQGAMVVVHEPQLDTMPHGTSEIHLPTGPGRERYADAIVVCAPREEYRLISLGVFDFGIVVIDPAGWCYDNLRDPMDPDCRYYCVGEGCVGKEWP
jgi:UDPglucose 6-dehydrogenase